MNDLYLALSTIEAALGAAQQNTGDPSVAEALAEIRWALRHALNLLGEGQ